MNNLRKLDQIAHIIRWFARIWGTALALFVIIKVGSELLEHLGGSQKFFIDSLSDIIGLIFFPLFCIGVGIGFKWEVIGGLIILGSILITMIMDGRFGFDLLTILFIISGFLYLSSWFLMRAKFGKISSDNSKSISN